jgi:hypothetical protein
MKFYLVCAAVFALMVIVLRSCGGEEYMSVAQASFHHHHGKGGEAKRKRLHRHNRYYGWLQTDRCLKCYALSVAVPTPRPTQRDTAGTQAIEDRVSIRNGFQVDIMEPGRTPQQIIDDVFLNIGWQ